MKMKLFNGEDILEFEKEGNQLTVTLDKTQVNLAETGMIQKYVAIIKKEDGIQAVYELSEGLIPFSQVRENANTKLNKLAQACQLSQLQRMEGKYLIPFLHPENLYKNGENWEAIHYGLAGLMSPKTKDKELFLKDVKALVLSIFQEKVSYEELLEGKFSLNDSFSKNILSAESLEELFAFLNAELVKEKEKIEATKRLVSRSGFGFTRIFGVLALLFAVVAGFFLYQYKANNEKSDAIVTAQTSFITNNYAKTQTDLEKYSSQSLPKSAKYILAVSSVNLADLTATQKQAILNTLSIKTDDNTLNYWVNMGRGNFDEALNLAQNLGDDQLTLLAYTDLYQATKLNTSMAGDKKQKLLQEYTKQIEELTKKLGK